MVAVTAGSGRSPSGPSKSKSVTQTVNGSHHFTIKGYSLAKGMGVGKYIASDTFTVGSYKWAIYFYPDGKNQEDNSQYVSLFIALASEGVDVRALFELTMLDQSGKNPPRHKVHSHFDRSLESGPYTLKYKGSMWGYKRFYRRAALESSDYLRDDCLNITCTVGVVMSATEGAPRPVVLPPPSPSIGKDFGAMLDDEQHCDVSFEVGDEVIMAHKLVLSARSEFFRANFYGPMRERRENPLPIEDMEPAVFRAMLQFIYTDSLPERGPYALTNVMAQHLLAAADRYGLERLRMMCEAKLCETVDTETVATTLALAEQHNAVQLKAICLSYAALHLAAVMETEGFEHLSESCPSLHKELLRVMAGVDAPKSEMGPQNSRWSIEAQAAAVWEDAGDGTDGVGRRVKPRLGHA